MPPPKLYFGGVAVGDCPHTGPEDLSALGRHQRVRQSRWAVGEKGPSLRGSGCQGGWRKLEGSRLFLLSVTLLHNLWLLVPMEYWPHCPSPRDLGLVVQLCFLLDNTVVRRHHHR